MKKILSVGAVLLISACQTAMPLQTNPETIVYNSSSKKIQNAVANTCINSQQFVESQTDNVVICSQQSGPMAQAFFGTKYGSGVYTKIQFNIVEMQPDAIKVIGRGWLENQNAFGGIKRDYLDNGQMPTYIKMMLDEIKKSAEG